MNVVETSSPRDVSRAQLLLQQIQNIIILGIMENEMETTIMENQMEKKMENEMETGVIIVYIYNGLGVRTRSPFNILRPDVYL